jgi:RecG-like helicase
MSFRYSDHQRFDLAKGLDPVKDEKLWDRGKVQEETYKIILKTFETQPGLILGDEVGMGKTWIALLAAIAVAEKGKNILVLTPSLVLAKQWEKQFRELVHQKAIKEKEKEKWLAMLTVSSCYQDLLTEAIKGETETRIFITSYGM